MKSNICSSLKILTTLSLFINFSKNCYASCSYNPISIVEFLHTPSFHYDVFTVKIDSSKQMHNGEFWARAIRIENYIGDAKDTVVILSGGYSSAGGDYLLEDNTYLVFGRKRDDRTYGAFVCDHYSISLDKESRLIGHRNFNIDVIEEWKKIVKSKYTGSKSYYLKDQLIAQGNYINGKPEGKWIFYLQEQDTFIQHAIRHYKDGFLHGEYRLQYRAKNNIHVENFEYGQLKEKLYFKNNEIVEKISYTIEGNKNIETRVSLNNGKTSKRESFWLTDISSISHINQLRHGVHEYYWSPSILKERGIYKNGKKAGIWEYYNESGKLKDEIDFKDSTKSENFKFFLGSQSYQGDTLNGLLNGRWEIQQEYVYKIHNFMNGNFEGRQVEFYKDYFRISHYKNGLLDSLECNITYEGDILEITNYDKSGQKHGPEYIYYSKNKLKQKNNYTHGFLDGRSESWYSNGNIKSIESYTMGQLNGYSKEMAENGFIKSEGYYYFGAKTGEWTESKFTGKRKERINFKEKYIVMNENGLYRSIPEREYKELYDIIGN